MIEFSKNKCIYIYIYTVYAIMYIHAFIYVIHITCTSTYMHCISCVGNS